jgi:hypothetical protein
MRTYYVDVPLPHKEYQNFLNLHVAITILCEKSFCMQYNHIAQKLLIDYVEGFYDTFGEQNVVSNFHYLLHLPEQVLKTRKTLDEMSTFKFESFMGPIKEYVTANHHPLQQIHRRVEEELAAAKLPTVKLRPKNSGVISKEDPNQFVNINYKGCLLDCSPKNQFVMDSEKRILKIEKISKINDNSVQLEVRQALFQGDYYEYPIRSLNLNIFKCENSWSSSPFRVNISQIQRKMFCVNLENNFVLLFPISAFEVGT